MADPPVLTVDAKQVAPAEEDSPRAELAHQRPFFTKMRVSGRHFHTGRRLAKAQLALQTIHTALPGTEAAIPQDCIKSRGPVREFSPLFQSNVGGLPFLTAHDAPRAEALCTAVALCALPTMSIEPNEGAQKGQALE
jgi:hypothetical protein